jgi:amidase
MAPFVGEAWGGFVQEHVVCRSVRDSALFLDIVDAPTPGEPYAAPHKARPWSKEIDVAPGTLRVAFCRDALYAGETHPDCTAALEDSLCLLRDLGHEVVEDVPVFPKDELVRAYLLTVACGTARFVATTSAAVGKKPKFSDYEPATWLLAKIGWKTSATELLDAQVVMQRASREVAEFFNRYDVFVTPTTAQPAARIGELAVTPAEYRQVAVLRHFAIKPVLDFALEKMATGKLAYTPNTQLFNQTGQPAMSVPLYWNSEGIPIGTQMVARFGEEATLFRLAAQLERARPWAGRKVDAGANEAQSPAS